MSLGWFEVMIQNGKYSGSRGIGLACLNYGQWDMTIWIPELCSLENCGKDLSHVGEGNKWERNYIFIRNPADVTIYYASDEDRILAMEKIWKEYNK